MFPFQAKYNTLQRRHEQTEMDLMQARLVATAIENEFDEDDIDGKFSFHSMKWYSWNINPIGKICLS